MISRGIALRFEVFEDIWMLLASKLFALAGTIYSFFHNFWKNGTTRNSYEKILIFLALIGSKRRFKWDLRPWKSSYCCYKA